MVPQLAHRFLVRQGCQALSFTSSLSHLATWSPVEPGQELELQLELEQRAVQAWRLWRSLAQQA
jgi:hypothetical protein